MRGDYIMERLTYRGANTPYFNKDGDEIKAYSDAKLREIINKLADYEDMEEQGRLIELPCNVGDRVWYIDKYCDEKPRVVKGEIEGFLWWRSCGFCLNIIWDRPKMWHFAYKRKGIPFTEINNTVFLTKEEAEKKLKEIK